MSGKELFKSILIHLCTKPSKERVPFVDLCKELGVFSYDSVAEALYKLESEGLVGIKSLSHRAMLCWITYDGRLMARNYNQDLTEGMVKETVPVIPTNELDAKVTGKHSRFSLNLDGLYPEHTKIVSGQNIVRQIESILQDSDDRRTALLIFVMGKTHSTLSTEII